MTRFSVIDRAKLRLREVAAGSLPPKVQLLEFWIFPGRPNLALDRLKPNKRHSPAPNKGAQLQDASPTTNDPKILATLSTPVLGTAASQSPRHRRRSPRQFDVHPNQTKQWKVQLLEGVTAFSGRKPGQNRRHPPSMSKSCTPRSGADAGERFLVRCARQGGIAGRKK